MKQKKKPKTLELNAISMERQTLIQNYGLMWANELNFKKLIHIQHFVE